MKIWRQKTRGILIYAICLGAFIAQPGMSAAQSVRTSFKRYAIHSFGDQKVLCEPYNVTKDDWLYKIFRQKGEISEKDFPLFLAIFKSINPDISNIDAINPGQQILIPLKTIDQEYFDESVPGIVDVPVVEFAALEKKIPPRYRQHLPFPNPIVSNLVAPNLVIPGDEAFPFIPTPVTSKTLAALEQYSKIRRGELLGSGKYYFPAKGSPDLVLDLAYTPLIKFQNGARTIIVPDRNHYLGMAETIQVFWPDTTLADLDTALETVAATPSDQNFPGQKLPEGSQRTALSHRVTTAMLVKQAGLKYEPDSVIHLKMDTLDLKIKVGKISRKEKPDLLVEYGDVYGFALNRIQEQGYELISLLPSETIRELAVKLFTALGIQVIEDPAFISTRTYRTITIPGVYIPCPNGEIMLLEKEIDLEAEDFLRERSISILRTNFPDSGA